MKNLLIALLILPFTIQAQTFSDYTRSAFSKIHNRDYNGAISDCNKAIKLNKNSPIPYISRAVCKNILDDARGALSDCKKALTLNPTDEDLGQLYLNAGFACYKLGSIENGCTYMSKAGELGVSQAYDFIKNYCN